MSRPQARIETGRGVGEPETPARHEVPVAPDGHLPYDTSAPDSFRS